MDVFEKRLTTSLKKVIKIVNFSVKVSSRFGKIGSKMEPISSDIWKKFLIDKDRQIFFCTALMQTIEALQAKRYTEFDAHIRTNCCQCVAVLVFDLIEKVKTMDLDYYYDFIKEAFYAMKTEKAIKNDKERVKSLIHRIPELLFDLLSLYSLNQIRDWNETGEMKSTPANLRSISYLSVSSMRSLVEKLQVYYSKKIIESVNSYRRNIPADQVYMGIPVKDWFKFVGSEYVRVDNRKTSYISCLYSFQLVLARILSSKIKIFVVNHVLNSNLEPIEKVGSFLVPTDQGNFRSLSSDEILDLDESDSVIVMSGYAIAIDENPISIKKKMNERLEGLSSIVLSGCIDHQEFPRINSDPNFDDSPIEVDDFNINALLESHKNLTGVTYADPTFFCLSHVYPASTKQVLDSMRNMLEDSLHGPYIPHYARKIYTQAS